MAMNDRKNGYDRTYELMEPKLETCDLKEAARRLGFCEPRDGALNVLFLGKNYRITNDRVVCTDDGGSHAVEKSLLIYYLISKGSGEPAGDYIFSTQLIDSPGMASQGGGLSWQTNSLQRIFAGRKAEDFARVMEFAGAEAVPSGKEGMQIWQLRVLPKISARILYFEADEEFPCMIQIKFDSGIRQYLEFEPAAFLQGCIIKRLEEGANRLL